MKRGYAPLIVLAGILVAGMAEAGSPISAKDVIWKFSKGNGKYIARGPLEGIKSKFNSAVMFDKLIEDPLKPLQRQAIVISDARSFAAVDELFNCTEPGEIQAIRVSGALCANRDPFDGVLASVEYALQQPEPPPLLLVMGNSRNEVVEDAVRLALGNTSGHPWEDSPVVKATLPAAQDAIVQDPGASFEDICDMAAKLNVWNTIEAMLVTSKTLHDAVKTGVLEVHGAFLDSETGKVHFMGEHPATEDLLTARPHHVRTASDAPVPPEQALSMLYAGNSRYQKGFVTTSQYVGGDRNKRLTEGGQSPWAVVVGCADSRAPPEILFDARPGNIFVLRTAGNTFASGHTSILGSAEYAVDHLRSKLIVVMGHTNCGAVTAAVEAVKAHANMKEVPGSIGRVLQDLQKEADAAITQRPKDATAAQVRLAAELNVFATMEKIIKSSPIIADRIRKMDVQVVGAIYDIESGAVQWLGQHPRLDSVLGSPIPMHTWKYSKPYVRTYNFPDDSVATREIAQLKKGNKRFRSGKTIESELSDTPFAIVLGGSELRVPIENIFDTSRGGLLVQRSMGNIVGHYKNALLHSLEYSVQRFSPKLLLVLGASDSGVIASSLDHLAGAHTGFGPSHIVHEAIGASALGALMQTSAGSDPRTVLTTAGRDMKRRGLTVEMNALYTVEQLFRHSEIIRDAVKQKQLEVHVGILQEDTGKVEFIGIHPMQEELLRDDDATAEAVVADSATDDDSATADDSAEDDDSVTTDDSAITEEEQLVPTVMFENKTAYRDSGAYFHTR